MTPDFNMSPYFNAAHRLRMDAQIAECNAIRACDSAEDYERAARLSQAADCYLRAAAHYDKAAAILLHASTCEGGEARDIARADMFLRAAKGLREDADNMRPRSPGAYYPEPLIGDDTAHPF
jgi:hypothetical protein